MKKQVLFVLLLTIGFTASGFAQGFKAQLPPGEGPQSKDPVAMVANRVDRLKGALKLTPEQVTEITAIMTQGTEQLMTLRNSGDRANMRAQARKIRMEQDSAIEALLDKRQLKRYLNYKARRNERGPRGGQPRPDDGK